MDYSSKVGIQKMSTTNADAKSVEKVELQTMGPNSSKVIPASKDIDNGANRYFQEDETKVEVIANIGPILNARDSVCFKLPENKTVTSKKRQKGNFQLIFT